MEEKEERWLLEEKYAGKRTPEFKRDCARLLAGEPLAYVIGWQPFLGMRIHLDSRPLIPRPETEWWTDELLMQLPKGRATDERIGFLDLCAGSGAIGCAALKRLTNARVYFGELEVAHEATIAKNIRENGLDESRASIHIGDLFSPFPHNLRFDVIAANPPYLPSGRALPESVAKWEPAEALYAGEDGLSVLRRIADELPHRLAKGGTAWIECDGAHAQDALALFAATGARAILRTDPYGVPRVIVVSFS